MVVKFKSAISKWYDLVGGSPQGSWNGQNSYIVSSDDNADSVPQDDQYKYCDDLSILELVMLGSLLTEYNFYKHVASSSVHNICPHNITLTKLPYGLKTTSCD